MKKILSLAAISLLIISCNENKGTTTETTSDSSTVNTDAGSVTTVTNTTVYTATDGDVTYRDGKLMEYRNGTWVSADKDLTLDDGTVVNVKGEAKDRNGKTVMVSDGRVVTRKGNWFDRAGNSIANAWDDTKDAVKEGANEVGQGAKKAADKVKETVN